MYRPGLFIIFKDRIYIGKTTVYFAFIKKYYNEDKEYLVSNLSNTKYATASEEDIDTLSKPVKILSVNQGMVKIKYETK
jgi:hypothetical protein